MRLTRIQSAGFASVVLLASAAWSQEIINMVEPGAAGIRVMTAEGIRGQTLTDSPYSADQTTRTTQTLADGNRIVNTSTAKVYRDQQGRTRVEQTLSGIGALTADQPRTIVSINDVVANVHYTLHPETRTAEKIETNGTPPSGKEAMIVKQQILKQQAEMLTLQKDMPRVVSTGVVGGAIGGDVEDLGVQIMEGLQVQGKRTKFTILAGAIGNDQPISIVDERWYSPELQMNIMTKHSDPRMGETVFTVTNVSRANPDASLFVMPADYQVTDSQKMKYRVAKSLSQ